jgi:hypothetical protein
MASFSGAVKQTVDKFNVNVPATATGAVIATCPDNSLMDVQIQGMRINTNANPSSLMEIQTFDPVANVWRGTAGAAGASAMSTGGGGDPFPSGIITTTPGALAAAVGEFYVPKFSTLADARKFGRTSPLNNDNEFDIGTGNFSESDLPLVCSVIRLAPKERLVIYGSPCDINYSGVTTTFQSSF